MTNMKKILFGLGTVTTVVAPVAAVVACGSDDKKEDTKKDGGSTTSAPAGDTTTPAAGDTTTPTAGDTTTPTAVATTTPTAGDTTTPAAGDTTTPTAGDTTTPTAVATTTPADDDTTTLVAGQWEVQKASDLESLFAIIAKSNNQWVNDFDGLFATLGGTTATPLKLEVYKANQSASKYSSDDYAILVKGNPSVATASTIDAAATAALESDWGVKTTDLKLASFFAIIKELKLSIYDVIATDDTGTNVGISTIVDTSFTDTDTI